LIARAAVLSQLRDWPLADFDGVSFKQAGCQLAGAMIRNLDQCKTPRNLGVYWGATEWSGDKDARRGEKACSNSSQAS
jgi:hypothetical protein